MKNAINVFGGTGFIGGRFCERHQDVIIQPRNDFVPKSNCIFYGISTTDNYNIYTNPYLDIETNLNLLILTLENARTKFGNNFTFVFLSSWFVYGKTDPVAFEDSPCDPTGFYSSTKHCAERLLKSYCETYGIRYKILRLANVLGVGDKRASIQKNAFQFLLKEMVQGRDVCIYNKASYRDFIHVDDVVSAINLCMADVHWDEIYNIGNGQSDNVKELLYYVHKQSNSMSNIAEIEVPEFHAVVQVPVFRMNTDKLSSLGYMPKYTIWKTIDELISYYRENK